MKNNPFKTKKITISASQQITENQRWIRFSEPLHFLPGQFIEISLPGFGEGPVAPCSDPEDKKGFEIVVRNVGPLTNQINKLFPGDCLFFRGPYGSGWPIRKTGKNLLIIAGGMGLIPLRPMIFKLIKNQGIFDNISLFIGSRNPESFIFKSEFPIYKKHFSHFKTIVDKAKNNYLGQIGLITDLLDLYPIDGKNTMAFICGPEPMYLSTIEKLLSKGFDDKNIWLSFERRMKCAVGLCQHCSLGRFLVCKDGPIFSWNQIKNELSK